VKTYYLTLADVLTIHSVSIKLHGGASGVRDLGALESAIFRPQTGYYSDLIAEAAALFESLAINHPFIDGNGRMGRLWQTLLLVQEFPVFEFLPFETMINITQVDYYKALSVSDKSEQSTHFIEYMLDVIDKSLSELLNYNNRTMTDIQRLEYFIQLNKSAFSRKEYMNVFKDISSATASRDLLKGTELKIIEKIGDKNKTRYRLI
jgi:Fic family protein